MSPSMKYVRERVCPDCGVTHINRQNQCSLCQNARAASYSRKKRRDIYDAIYEHIGHSKCIDCGNDDKRVHVFHHIDPTTKEYEISDVIRTKCGMDTILREVDKCVLLCSNCHIIRHYIDT